MTISRIVVPHITFLVTLGVRSIFRDRSDSGCPEIEGIPGAKDQKNRSVNQED